MKKLLRFIGNKFLNKQLDFRVRLFNVLAMAGVLAGLVMGTLNTINGGGIVSVLTGIGSASLSFALLYYAYASGRYQRCYLITIAVIFMGYFPTLFLRMGGYHGGKIAFFIFAVVFTAFMLEGKTAWIVTLVEVAFYSGVCVYAYAFPESVRRFPTEFGYLTDSITNFVFVSIALSVTLIQHLRMYNQQQRDLEAARQEAIKYADAKSAFLANMSHEIRTPINVMLGMNEMILRESDSETIRSYGLNIQNAGKTLLFLINNILDVSRIESGKLETMEEHYQTADLIDDLSLTGMELVGKKGIRFEVEADESLPGMLFGDFIHTKQVVANFLSNAAKYTKEGSVALSFSGKRGERPGELIFCISVTDTGIGIKQEDIPFLFDAFTRVDLPGNRNIEGTGLGLAIARQLTELMGGQIFVASVWNKGSTFSVEIPQKIGDETTLGKLQRHAGVTEDTTRGGSFIAPGCSVLVVDDNRENRQVIRSLLARTMLRVDVAESGARCLKAVRGRRYDVILMDYMMPGMDGVETLSRLKEIPGFDTPLVALTANVVAGTRESLLNAGFCEYLPKPVMWRDLEATLLAILPKELVMMGKACSVELLPDETKEELSRELSNYGVLLDDGLRYLGGDVLQYGKLAALFEDNYEQARDEIGGLAVKRDWSRMQFLVHSLKSKAQAVGANNLSTTASKLEKLCALEDGVYIAVILPVLYHEWERARDGLGVFAKRLEGILPESGAAGVQPVNLDALLTLLRYNRHPDALEALDRLIATASAPQTAEVLREIWRRVDNMEFREAESLLLDFMKGVTV